MSLRRVKILVLPGSTRQESYNKKLARLAAGALRAAGGEVTLVDLRDHPLPLYDGDLEAQIGLPPAARELKRLFQEHQGLLVASPEYNASITGVLKNALDWISRREPGEEPLAALAGKVAALVSASPGELGGSRGLITLRLLLANLKALVLPEQVSVPRAAEVFRPDGTLSDERRLAALNALAAHLVAVTAQLQA